MARDMNLVVAFYEQIEEQREYLSRAEQRASAQLELLGDLLELAHLQNPDLAVKHEPVDPAELRYEVRERMNSQAQEKRTAFTASIPKKAPAISADPSTSGNCG